jgi:5,5'-dehydrodivanillate O-demethylase
LIFGYIGPLPAPLLPPYDLLVWTNAQKVIRRALVPCNWLQIVENSLDPAHLEWLHGHYSNDIAALAGASPPLEVRHHTKLGFDVFDGGIVKRRLLEGQTTADEDWMIGQQLIFPACFRVGTSGRCSFQFRVPVDDTSTWVFWYECVLAQDNGVTALDDVAVVDIDYLDENGDFRLDTIDGQDIMAWVTAGEIADRSVERLGKADEGIILYRKLLREQLRSVEQGYDPIGVLRQDPSGGIIAMPLRTMALPVTERADADAEWAPLPCD